MLNKSPITEIMNKIMPSMNMGFLPMTSAARGRIKEPVKVPMKKLDPMNPIVKGEAQSRSYC